jgi:hypothetical protein
MEIAVAIQTFPVEAGAFQIIIAHDGERRKWLREK